MKRAIVMAFLVCLLPLQIESACADAPHEQKIVKYARDRLSVYQKVGSGFVKGEAKVPAADLPALPAAVLESAPEGYVMINGSSGAIWLLRRDVDIDTGEAPIVPDCRKSALAKPAGTTTLGAPGIGGKQCE